MSQRRKGWILNAHDAARSHEVESDAAPAITLDDGSLVFEFWHYDALLRRWFVMSTEPNAKLAAAGVVYYHPNEVPHGLRARVGLLDKMAGVVRR